MLYNWIKIFHVLTASALLGIIVNNLFCLLTKNERSQFWNQTVGLAILLWQLISGFAMIYNKPLSLSLAWWIGVCLSYGALLMAWLLLLYARVKSSNKLWFCANLLVLLVLLSLYLSMTQVS